MANSDQLEVVVNQYYDEIFCYTLSKLKPDIQGAKECTQDVFLLLFEKKDSLDLSGNIRAWLYQSANNIIKSYIRNEAKHRHLSLNDVTIPSYGELEQFFSETTISKIKECLTAQEFRFLYDYYSLKRGNREKLAEQYGMTQSQLYAEIKRLKKKILCSIR